MLLPILIPDCVSSDPTCRNRSFVNRLLFRRGAGMIDSTEGLKQLRDEIFIMCQLDHPNIVRYVVAKASMNACWRESAAAACPHIQFLTALLQY
jgi:hypothetical protein